MNAVIDAGNTLIKVAFFTGDRLEKKYSFSDPEELKALLKHPSFDAALVSSVTWDGREWLNWITAEKKWLMTNQLPVPVRIRYQTPDTLGMDRLAAVCGARVHFPDRDTLVIDAGTCVTYDFVDAAGNYWGGAISPGIDIRFEALHTFTQRLPRLQKKDRAELIGNSTENSMQSGVLNGLLAEMEGTISKYRHIYPDLCVILCGGDSLFFENNLKPTIFAAPDLVLSGLNRILLYNAVE